MHIQLVNLKTAAWILKSEMSRKTLSSTSSLSLARLQMSKALYEFILELEKMKTRPVSYDAPSRSRMDHLVAKYRNMLESAYRLSSHELKFMRGSGSGAAASALSTKTT